MAVVHAVAISVAVNRSAPAHHGLRLQSISRAGINAVGDTISVVVGTIACAPAFVGLRQPDRVGTRIVTIWSTVTVAILIHHTTAAQSRIRLPSIGDATIHTV